MISPLHLLSLDPCHQYKTNLCARQLVWIVEDHQMQIRILA